MALIRCPQCRQRMSSLSPSCPQCGYRRDRSQTGNYESNELRLQRLKLWRYRLRMASYTAMTLMLAGVIAWWLDSGMLDAPGTFAKLAMAIGVVAYAGLRSSLFRLAQQIKVTRKALRETRQAKSTS